MKQITLFLLIVLLTGCSTITRLGQFTAASTHNVRNLNYSLSDKSKQLVEGETCIHYFFGIPLGHDDDRLQRATDNAIRIGQESGLDGDLLVNVRMDNSYFSIFFYAENCVKIEGDLVKIQPEKNK